MICVGTKNKRKQKQIISICQKIIPELKFKILDDFNIKTPIENGKNESERALKKAEFYFKKINITTISEDDGIYFNKTLSIPTGIDIAQADKQKNNKYVFWKKTLQNNQITSGYIRKSYAIVNKDIKKVISIEIPFRISFVSDVKNISEKNNILNYFLIPEGFNEPFNCMKKNELNKYRELYLLKPLQTLLKTCYNS